MNIELKEFHQQLGARPLKVNGAEAVADYGHVAEEHSALKSSAGLLDLSFRGRICLTGADRARFLHGQLTNDIKRLKSGDACYAALTTAKGRMQSDVYVFCLAQELLLDFEPGRTSLLTERLEKYIVADDVQLVDVAGLYGLLSVQGPLAEKAASALSWFSQLPAKPLSFVTASTPDGSEIYLANNPRLGTRGYDVFAPQALMRKAADELVAAVRALGGRPCGWNAFELARIEAGIPRFGLDMDENSFPQECGIEKAAVSYTKGCYIGQETLNRIHTQGHTNRQLWKIRLGHGPGLPPPAGSKLYLEQKEVGHVTSTMAEGEPLALGYLRREVEKGANVRLVFDGGESAVELLEPAGRR